MGAGRRGEKETVVSPSRAGAGERGHRTTDTLPSESKDRFSAARIVLWLRSIPGAPGFLFCMRDPRRGRPLHPPGTWSFPQQSDFHPRHFRWPPATWEATTPSFRPRWVLSGKESRSSLFPGRSWLTMDADAGTVLSGQRCLSPFSAAGLAADHTVTTQGGGLWPPTTRRFAAAAPRQQARRGIPLAAGPRCRELPREAVPPGKPERPPSEQFSGEAGPSFRLFIFFAGGHLPYFWTIIADTPPQARSAAFHALGDFGKFPNSKRRRRHRVGTSG